MNDRDTLICALFLLATFAVQLAVLFATRRRLGFLRFAVPVLVGAASIIFIMWSYLTAAVSLGILPGIFLTWMVVIICLLLASLALMGWGLAWAVYSLAKWIVE